MICAPLAKSPNCASHSTSVSGIGHAVAELEAEHGVFAERAVEDFEAGLVGRDVLQRHVFAGGFGIVEGQVPLAESAAAGILAAEAHRRSFQHQRTEGQRFAEGPIDGPPFSITSRRFSIKPRNLGCRWKFSGKWVRPRMTRSMVALFTVVRGQIAGNLFAGNGGQLLHLRNVRCSFAPHRKPRIRSA